MSNVKYARANIRKEKNNGRHDYKIYARMQCRVKGTHNACNSRARK